MDSHAVTDAAVDNSGAVEKSELRKALVDSATRKSEGQELLERLLAVRASLAQVRERLGIVKQSIGLAPPLPAAERASTVTTTQFFPALRLIADEIERATREIATDVEDLANGF